MAKTTTPTATPKAKTQKTSAAPSSGGVQVALPAGYITRLQKKYREEVIPALMKKFGYKSVMECPRLEKICLNQGVKGSTSDKKMIDDAVSEMTIISGQRAIPTMSKKDISNFKLRKNMPIGCRVTLRHVKMYEFLDRFCNIVSPRIRDFRGFPLKCDGRGSYSLGLTDQQVFPEINLDEVKRTQANTHKTN